MGSAVPPPPRPIEYRDLDDRGWLLSLLFGVALVVLGVWLLMNLFESVAVLAVLVGISLIVAGVVEVVALGGGEAAGWFSWLGGALLVVAGLAVLTWPDITLQSLAIVAGAGLVAAGVLRVRSALSGRDSADFPVQLGLGGAGIALGVVAMVWPDATLVVLAMVLGLKSIATGLVAIGLGWQLHRLPG